MNKLQQFSLLIVSMIMLNACTSPAVDHYAATEPELDLKTFFDGRLLAHGMLQNRSGTMTRRFVATIDASWEGETGTLVEEFRFDDGEIEYRTWVLTHHGDGHYSGTAGDVSGMAEGQTSGSVFHWQYRLEVPWREGSVTVNMDDWMYLIDENLLINRTKLTKFGFRLGELTIVIQKA